MIMMVLFDSEFIPMNKCHLRVSDCQKSSTNDVFFFDPQKMMFRDVHVDGLSRYHDFRYVMVYPLEFTDVPSISGQII